MHKSAGAQEVKVSTTGRVREEPAWGKQAEKPAQAERVPLPAAGHCRGRRGWVQELG